MDPKKFDQSIRGKLEAFEAPDTPSAAEWNRLQVAVGAAAPGFWQRYRGWAAAAAILLLLGNGFLGWNLWSLNQSNAELSEEVERLKADQSLAQNPSEPEIRYLPGTKDTVYIIEQRPTPQMSYRQLNREDVGALVREEIIPAIQKDPEMLALLKKELNIKTNNPDRIANADSPDSPSAPVETPNLLPVAEREALTSLLAERPDLLDKLLQRFERIDSEQDASNPDSEKSYYGQSDPTQIGLLTQLLESEGEAVVEWLETEQDPSDSTLAEYLSPAVDTTAIAAEPEEQPVDSAYEAMMDSLRALGPPPEESNDPGKSISVDWFAGIHAGTMFGSLDMGGTMNAFPIGLHTEVLLEERLSFRAGATYYKFTGEEETESGGLRVPEGFPGFDENQPNDYDEIKLNLTVIEIPVEARYYLFPKKEFSPYGAAGAQIQLYAKEDYLFKDEYDPIVSEQYQYKHAEWKQSLLGFHAGLGARYYFDPRLSGSIQANYRFGQDNLGTAENRLSGLQFQFNFNYLLTYGNQ